MNDVLLGELQALLQGGIMVVEHDGAGPGKHPVGVLRIEAGEGTAMTLHVCLPGVDGGPNRDLRVLFKPKELMYVLEICMEVQEGKTDSDRTDSDEDTPAL